MRIVLGALLVAILALGPAGEAAARDRTTACRPFLMRGPVWAGCCKQSYTRHPRRAMSRRARLREIERCVRMRVRRP
ncbi:MAG: hypothetical protein ACRECO_05575 [Xanthobacteraceae bacterium]